MKYSKQLKHQRNRPNERNKAWGKYIIAKKTNLSLNFEKFCKNIIDENTKE